MLSVRGLRVRYGVVEAVRGIDLDVAEGEIVALLGANGAGKSSTLLAIAGLVPPAAGAITLDGAPIAGLSPERIARRGLALTPEGRRVFGGLTVAENLVLGAAAHCRGAEQQRRRERLLDRFPVLRERYQQRAGLLSGGEQQMLALARSLIAAPRLLLLDEPSLGLAPQLVETVMQIVEELRDEGQTILLVEQNVARALDVADRGYVLVNGAVELADEAEALLASDRVKDAYLAL